MKTEIHVLPDETRVSIPVENEVVRVLRDALRRLGPNGENWWQGGPYPAPDHPRCDTASCAGWAVMELCGARRHGSEWRDNLSPALGLLDQAARQLSDKAGYISLNDDAASFSEVRAMFELAIDMASPPYASQEARQ